MFNEFERNLKLKISFTTRARTLFLKFINMQIIFRLFYGHVIHTCAVLNYYSNFFNSKLYTPNQLIFMVYVV